MKKANFFLKTPFSVYFCAGEMAERSNAAVLKTVEVQASGGSNPSLSAYCFINACQNAINDWFIAFFYFSAASVYA
jgi:hypothetical protein